MKNFLGIFLFLTFSAVIFSQPAYSQKKKTFKGNITYEVTYSGKDLTPAEKAQFPSEIYKKILGNKIKSEIILGAMTQHVIYDYDNKTMTMIFISIQGKAHLKFNEEEIKEYILEKNELTIKYLEETKIIAGYTAKKAEITEIGDDGEENTYFVYYSDELGSKASNFAQKFKDIDGLLLEYQDTKGDMIVNFTIKEIKKGKVKDIDFFIPSDSEEITGEDKEQILQRIKDN
ncbi:hypothetical protein ACFLRZ_01320 [Bacteroidota bacterium]